MQENKDFISRYLKALSGKPKTTELIREYVADPKLVKHIVETEAAFPAYELIPEEILSDEDMVAVRATFRGVHRGTFAGIESTHRTVSTGLIIMYQVRENRIVQHWLQFDLFSALQQLQDASAATSA